MSKTQKNTRCPLQAECEKKCEYIGNEIKCQYYYNNGIGDSVIPDQEEIRKLMERQTEEENYAAALDEITLDEEDEKNENGADEKKRNIVWISVDHLYPHPDNPRKNLGDLQELADSIKAKGIMQNLTVVPGHALTDDEWRTVSKQYSESPSEELRMLMNRRKSDAGYTVVIGHRRTEAAKLAGLTELPCIITDMTPAEQIQTMLLENMQRSDLTVYEQAQGFQMMMDFGDSIEGISEKTGFSKTTVRRRLKMAELDQNVLKSVSDRQLSLFDFDRISEIKDIKERNTVLKQMGTNNFENVLASALSKQKLKENQQRWLEELEKYNATEIPEKDRWDSTKYVTLPYCAITANPEEKLKELFDGEGPFYYYMDKWGSIYLRKGKTQAETDEAMVRQMEREQRDERNRQIRAALDDAFERAYKLRFDFIKSISETTAKKHIADIARFIVVTGFSLSFDFDTDVLAELLRIEIPKDPEDHEYEDEEEAEKVFAEAAANSPYYSLLATSYALADDSKNSNCYNWNYNYNKSEHLERLYDFLTALGYEMSDEERELLNGESNLYVKPAPPADNINASNEENSLDIEDENELSGNGDEGIDNDSVEPEKNVVEQLKEMYGADE